MNPSDIITCSNCQYQQKVDYSQKHCSNCFSCSGCEIYVCNNCGKLITIIPVTQQKSTKATQN